jgi:SnoaL-like domain
MWHASRMPWVPELFSAPVLESFLEKRREERLVAVPFFDGLLAGEPEALLGSFAGEPEMHHPVLGRIKGTRAFTAYVSDMNAWFREHHVSIEDVERVMTQPRGVEEVVVHVDGAAGRVALPIAIVADRVAGGRIDELRMYYSNWPLNGTHATRPPLLQPDPELREPEHVIAYQRALAAGDVDAVVAAFEPDGYAREPAGADPVHRGPDELRALYARVFTNGGGVKLDPCAVVGDDRACALEYNVVRWGETELPPEAGVGVYERGPSGKLAAARIYVDIVPPLRRPSDADR